MAEVVDFRSCCPTSLPPGLPPARGASSRFSAARSDPSLCICSLLAASCTDSLVAHPPSSPAFLMALSCHSPCPAGACTTCWSCPPAPARACFSGLDADLWWELINLQCMALYTSSSSPWSRTSSAETCAKHPKTVNGQRARAQPLTPNQTAAIHTCADTQAHKYTSAGRRPARGLELYVRNPSGPHPAQTPAVRNPSSPVRGVGADCGGWGWSGGAHTIICRAASFD
jgi:hypothetical protein